VSVRPRVIVVGGGLAGLACTMKLAEEGIDVDLFSATPSRQSHSVCAQGGINACNQISRQECDSEWAHFDETILGGDFLADQPPVHEMCYWAPRIVDLLDRMGVPFDRTAEGQRALRFSGGSLARRTFFAGATSGQQILYAFDEQVRRREADGRVNRHEYWEFLWPVIQDGACLGIVAQDLRSMRIAPFAASAVVIATGGNGMIFGRTTMSLGCTGAAASRCYQAGAKYANPEFIQIHPTAISGQDKCRLVSEAVRGEGARMWVPAVQENGTWKPHPSASRGPNSVPESERWYFLEDRYARFGNLVPRDIAALEITSLCRDGFGVGDGSMVYVDLRDVVKESGGKTIAARLNGAIQLYRKFGGADPLEEPMRVTPAVHASMGGLWVGCKKDEKTGGLKAGDPANMSTNIVGLYAMGEVSFAYHGANRLGGNGVLSRIFDGLFGGTCVKNYCQEAPSDPPPSLFESAVRQENARVERLFASDGNENPHLLAEEVGRWMTEHCTVIRLNDKLEMALDKCQQWKQRARRIRLSDTSNWANQSLPFARSVRDMIVMAEAILRGALLRNESRGAHFKPAYPDRDDVNFLKATIATYDAEADRAAIHYEPVDTSLIAPRPRTYGRKPAVSVVKAEKVVAV
jgi:succinate dehydrogenase / fumarate reductase, flavoprotein subunit